MNLSSNIKKILELLIKINISLIIFLIPIFFSPPFFMTANVFELPKNIIFHILVLILSNFVFLDFIFFGNKINIQKIKEWTIKNRLIIFAIFLYLFSFFLSFLFSDFKLESYFGSNSRQMGFLTYLYFILFFVLYLSRKKNNFIGDLLILTLSSFLISVYGVMQSLSLDFNTWSELTYLRVTSTMGQPNALGMFLALVLPLNIYFFYRTVKVYRYFFLFSFLISLLTIGYTYSFTTWIGLSLATIVAFVFVFYKKRNLFYKKNNIFFFLAISLFILLSVYLVFNNSYTLRMKLKTVFNTDAGSTAARINYWEASIKGIVGKPIVGYGSDTQGEIIPKFYETDWGVPSNIGIINDRAHNFILDYLLTTGILGLVSYLILLSVFFKIIYLNIKNNKEVLINYAIGFSLLSYICILFFNFPIISTEFIFWLYFAIILSIYFSSQKITNFSEDSGNKSSSNYLKILLKLFFGIIFLIFSFYLIRGEQNKLIADKYFLDIKKAYLGDRYFKSLVIYDYIRDLNLRTDYYDLKFGKILSDWTPNIEKYGRIYNIKGREYMLSIYKELDDIEYSERLSKANILSVLSRDDDLFLKEAEERLTSLIADYPGLPQNYYNLANFYYHSSRYDEAEKTLKEELEKIPEIDNKNLNNDHRATIEKEVSKIYELLGDISYRKNDYIASEKYYTKSNLIVEKSDVHHKLADLYKKNNNYELAIWHAKRAIRINKNDYFSYYYLANLYYELNDYTESSKYLDQSLRLFPGYSDGLELRNKIKNIVL